MGRGRDRHPADDIRTLARGYAAAQPSMIRIGVAIERHAGGGQTVRAISCLPGLVGAWRRPGGGPGGGPGIHALMVFNSNPVVVCPDQERVLAGLAREDLFTVVSEQFLTDTAQFADIVFPAASQLEQLDVMFSWGHFYIGLNLPSIPPVGESVSNTELFRRLAAAMGYTEDCFTMTDEQMIDAAYDWAAPALDGITPATLAETGWARLNLPAADAYAPHAEGGFPDAGQAGVPLRGRGRGQLRAAAVPAGQQRGPARRGRRPAAALHPAARDGRVLPALADLAEVARVHQLQLRQPGGQQRVAGEPSAWLHPSDATDRDIADGDLVRVHNERGEILVKANVTEDVTRGVVMAAMGAWRAQTKGQHTVNAINPTEFADLGHAPTFNDTRVEIERA